jgi:hypothetical protein
MVRVSPSISSDGTYVLSDAQGESNLRSWDLGHCGLCITSRRRSRL